MTLPIRQRKETSDALRSQQPTHQLQPNAARVKWDSCYRADNNCCFLEGLKCTSHGIRRPCTHELYFRHSVVTLTKRVICNMSSNTLLFLNFKHTICCGRKWPYQVSIIEILEKKKYLHKLENCIKNEMSFVY